MAGISIDALVSRARPAELEREFEERLADSGRLAFRVAYAVLRRREDAEDVAQEALARAYTHLPSLRDRARFRAWLVRICWRLAQDHRRAARRRELREQAATAPLTVDGEGQAAAGEFQRRLFEAIDGLPEKQRVVVVLAAIEGHDMGEVAALLRIPEGTVKSRLHQARRRLAEALR